MRGRWIRRASRREIHHGEATHAGERDGTPVVPFLPVRCPGCQAPKPETDGVHDLNNGRFRYHTCKACGIRFRSVELTREDFYDA